LAAGRSIQYSSVLRALRSARWTSAMMSPTLATSFYSGSVACLITSRGLDPRIYAAPSA
jgi:hypothetical protein